MFSCIAFGVIGILCIITLSLSARVHVVEEELKTSLRREDLDKMTGSFFQQAVEALESPTPGTEGARNKLRKFNGVCVCYIRILRSLAANGVKGMDVQADEFRGWFENRKTELCTKGADKTLLTLY